MRDQRRIPEEVEQLFGLVGEQRLVRHEGVAQTVYHLRFERHVPLGVEISVIVTAGLDSIDDLDTADLDHAIAAHRVEARGFRVEDDFSHGSNLSTAADSETSQNVADLAFCCG